MTGSGAAMSRPSSWNSTVSGWSHSRLGPSARFSELQNWLGYAHAASGSARTGGEASAGIGPRASASSGVAGAAIVGVELVSGGGSPVPAVVQAAAPRASAARELHHGLIDR